MPTIEQITPEENRVLLTTLGDWESDGYWSPSGFPEIYGLMMFDFEAGDPTKQAVLSYPNVKATPGYTHTFSCTLYKSLFQYVGPCSWVLTDGNYSFGGEETPPWDIMTWPFEEKIEIPNDWIEENTTLTITFESLPASDFKIACSRFSLTYFYERKIKYLPLTGIG